MKIRIIQLFMLLGLAILACQPEQIETSKEADTNPPAEGFNAENSDEQAIIIADKVMNAMGGRAAWDATRHIKWNFFGSRTLYWDKYTGDVRIERPAQNAVTVFNIQSREGRSWIQEREITEPDSLKNLLNSAYSAWVNDSYWLVMPYKLKDSGVTLNYLGEESLEDGTLTEKLQLTFEAVGVTPQNKYHVWVDQGSHLVVQWAYFANAQDEEPRIITPWADYNKYGKILLSGNRGERSLSDIEVFDELPESVYKDLGKGI
jgi:plasmid maintenance system killer protein